MYDGVVDTVKKLSEKYPLFIVSNCQCGYIEAMLNASGLGSYIKDHLCFEETQTPKSQTHPEAHGEERSQGRGICGRHAGRR